MTVQYEKVLAIGYRGIIEEANEAKAKLRFGDGDYARRTHFLDAVIISCEAVINYAHRYAALCRSEAAILEKNNFSVDAVYDGVEALEYLDSRNYDGVIMDVMMPRMDGITALKKLRASGNMVPVLVLTARNLSPENRLEGGTK